MKLKFRKNRKFILIGLVFILLFIAFGYLNNGTERKIKDGEIQYSEELGWINWGHANPSGTQKAFADFKNKNQLSTTNFSFSYTQTMRYRFLGVSFFTSYNESWKIIKQPEDSNIKNAFLKVFTSVSEGFESMQNKPIYALSGSKPSSFREGDLMGNLISFYCVVSKSSVSEVKQQLTLWNTKNSLNKYNKEGLERIHWNEMKIKKNESNILIQKLISILKKSKNLPHSGTRITRN